jgi:hypothetical protein
MPAELSRGTMTIVEASDPARGGSNPWLALAQRPPYVSAITQWVHRRSRNGTTRDHVMGPDGAPSTVDGNCSQVLLCVGALLASSSDVSEVAS